MHAHDVNVSNNDVAHRAEAQGHDYHHAVQFGRSRLVQKHVPDLTQRARHA